MEANEEDLAGVLVGEPAAYRPVPMPEPPMAQRKPRPMNDNDPLGIEVGVVEVRDAPGEWLVEAIDCGSEGEIYRAVFSGPMAEQRARAYALLTYGTPSAPTQSFIG